MLQVYDRVVPTRGVPTLLLLTLILVVALGRCRTIRLSDRESGLVQRTTCHSLYAKKSKRSVHVFRG
jgi:ABC-type protease/lipase transport system fused ATPase/permease subunit